VEANRIFFNSCTNNNNTIFGGELMSWMEQHAVHCGRMFTGNRNVYTIGMHSVAFPEPVFSTDWVTLEATVIYVRNTTMEVDVVLRAERQVGGAIMTNRASFVLINNDDIGQKSGIPLGLELNGATQDELQQFAEARQRYQRSVEQRDAFYVSVSRTGTTKL
jgi:acyl-CoA hydrolase